MDNEFTPIRKIINGITINTDTAYLLGSDQKMVSEISNEQVIHTYIRQSLYQMLPNGPFFLAFWNKPQWDNTSMGITYIEESIVIDIDQAKQWMRTHCPTKFDAFEKRMNEENKTTNMVPINLRMPADLRVSLNLQAALSSSSFNKICLNLIHAGLSYQNSKIGVSIPSSFDTLKLPSGQPAIDQYELANKFDNQDDQALANYAEHLYRLQRSNSNILPFVLQVLYRLLHINRDEKRAMCFALWLTSFRRATGSDNDEYMKRNPGTREYGQWQWIKSDPPFDTTSLSRYV